VTLDKREILAAAEQYLRHHEAEAADYARRCAAAMLLAADVEAWQIWTQVILAIEELQLQR
jgi:hypothetical protein